MKRLAITLSLLVIFTYSKSQVKALTENGREVLLNANGTWQYVSASDSSTDSSDSISTNPASFHTAAAASFLVKSNVFNVGVFINPKKWVVTPHKSNEVNPEYRFEAKSQNGFAIIMTEPTSVELENMKNIAVINAQKAAPDIKLLHSEYRIVNNNKVLCLTMKGTIQGIKFVYFGYYYSNSNGTVQLLTYGSEKMFKESSKDWEDFLGGFTVIN
jgi:hypothetical protein